LTIKFIPKETLDVYREEAKTLWLNGKPKKWYFGIPIALFWVFIVWLIIKAII
jgi:hypothetical protein